MVLGDLVIWADDEIKIDDETIDSIYHSFGEYVKAKYEKLITKQHIDHAHFVLYVE